MRIASKLYEFVKIKEGEVNRQKMESLRKELEKRDLEKIKIDSEIAKMKKNLVSKEICIEQMTENIQVLETELEEEKEKG